jgi:hypothetical protein
LGIFWRLWFRCAGSEGYMVSLWRINCNSSRSFQEESNVKHLFVPFIACTWFFPPIPSASA